MAVENLKYWIDKDGNKVWGSSKYYNKSLEYLIKNNPEDVISKNGIDRRKLFHKLFLKILPLTSKNKFVILDNSVIDRNEFEIVTDDDIPKDRKVVYVCTHGFKDDIALALATIKRHAYIAFASIPDFYYTIDGYALWANGVFVMDRKDSESKKALLSKVNYAFKNGLNSILIYTEGVWNKDPNELILKQWKGAYCIAKENDALIVPIVTLNKDMKIDNDEGICYSMMGKPIDSRDYTIEEAKELVRNAFSTGKYVLYDKFSHYERSKIGNAEEYWDKYVSELIKSSNVCKKCYVETKDNYVSLCDSRLYDYEIENDAEYIDKNIVTEEDVFSCMKNVTPTTGNAKVYVKTYNIKGKKKKYFE
ncbi:MAG: 1-acyl-sn-glycerol-3-phosphate acyltransferase [bacterium]|nr:1-acyl-sn-glycerol-3-phosphate acyltransferase [bacterium]